MHVGGRRCSLLLLLLLLCQVDDVVSTEVEQTVVSLSAAKMDEVSQGTQKNSKLQTCVNIKLQTCVSCTSYKREKNKIRKRYRREGPFYQTTIVEKCTIFVSRQ